MSRFRAGPHAPIRTRALLCLIAVLSALAGCWGGNIIPASDSTTITNPVTSSTGWTILVYMIASDPSVPDLATKAFSDFNAMESVDLSGLGIALFALVDLGPGGASISPDNSWSGARFYQIENDPGGAASQAIVSQRIGALGLTATGTNEDIDLGDPTTVSSFFTYAKTVSPTHHYAMIFWGHGDGWRDAGVDGSGTSDLLTILELCQALKDQNLDVIGFDGPSEAMIEVAYQLGTQSAAHYMIASEGSTPSTPGWDFGGFLGAFSTSTRMTNDLIGSIVDTYSTAQAGTAGATISAVDLSQTGLTQQGPLVPALNGFAGVLGTIVTDAASQLAVRSAILSNVQGYSASSTDTNLDLFDLAQFVSAPNPPGPGFGLGQFQAREMESGVLNAVKREWHNATGSPRAHGLSVYYVTGGSAVDPSYVLSAGTDQLAFLSASTWPPAASTGPGLLYLLWMKSFP